MEKGHHATVPPPVGVTFWFYWLLFHTSRHSARIPCIPIFAVFASWMLGASRRDETILLLLLLLLTEKRKGGPSWKPKSIGIQGKTGEVHSLNVMMSSSAYVRWGGDQLLACQACQLTPANKGPRCGTPLYLDWR